MKHSRQSMACGAISILAACAAIPPPAVATEEIAARVMELLERYERNDQDGVLAMTDPAGFTILGSDVSEVVHSPEELREMMRDDFKLWGSARFGSPMDLDIRVSRDLAVAMFHVPFALGANPPVVVRFSTTWHRVRDRWYLTQSANTVPTRGSSAKQLLIR